MTTAAEFIDVVAAVAWRDDRLLLCQRREGPHLPLLWEFPGGKINRGETAVEALRRELVEELGVESEIGSLLGTVRHRYPEKNVAIRFYSAVIIGEPQALIHRRIRWIPVGELAEYPVPPANAPVIGKILDGRLAAC